MQLEDYFYKCNISVFVIPSYVLLLASQLDEANVYKETKQFTYKDGSQFVFMDLVLFSIPSLMLFWLKCSYMMLMEDMDYRSNLALGGQLSWKLPNTTVIVNLNTSFPYIIGMHFSFFCRIHLKKLV